MQQKATKYASSGNNVLLNYVDQLFFPNLLSFFNFQFLFLIFNLAGTHLQTVDFFFPGGSKWGGSSTFAQIHMKFRFCTSSNFVTQIYICRWWAHVWSLLDLTNVSILLLCAASGKGGIGFPALFAGQFSRRGSGACLWAPRVFTFFGSRPALIGAKIC